MVIKKVLFPVIDDIKIYIFYETSKMNWLILKIVKIYSLASFLKDLNQKSHL